jgi:hypothetical protein
VVFPVAPNASPQTRAAPAKTSFTTWGCLVIIVVVAFVFMAGSIASNASKEDAKRGIPPEEARLCGAVDRGASAFQAAEHNEIREDASKEERRPQLENLIVKDWVGTLSDISTTASSGNAYISIALPCDVTTHVKTWNNSLSDLGDKTMIAKGSALYSRLATLHQGQQVRFSADLVRDRTGGPREASMTVSGSMTDPEFIARFTSITP